VNISRLVERIALLDPQRPAVFVGARQVLDYAALHERIARLAGALRGHGLAPGDRVALYMQNSTEYLLLLHAVLWAGLVVVPVNAKLHVREVDYIAEHAGARLIFVSGAVAQGAGETTRIDAGSWLPAALAHDPLPPHDSRLDDLAWLFYTSGTTGRPKGVMLSHRNLTTMTLCYQADVDQVEAADAVVYAAPMSHGAGLYTFAYMAAGGRHVVPASGGFDAAELFGLAANLQRLCLFAAPTMVARLVDHAQREGLAADGFRTIVYGGGPMYLADIRRARDVMGPRFVQIYGQGESPMTITFLSRAVIEDVGHPAWLARLASVGVRHCAVDVRIVDDQGLPLPSGTIGEVVVRGDTVMQGYWRDPAASAAALRDGWLCTGDMGAIDDAGFLTLKDRSKDLVISGGSNIYPREVEEVLLQHPGVAEAAVIGAPDPEWGECVIAFIVASPGSGELAGELEALCLDRIARFKRPKRYLEVASLPKNNYGKVLKTELRSLYAELHPSNNRATT
jgi:long-chain acyl-CoA synthetase